MANIKITLGFVPRPDGATRWLKAYEIILEAARQDTPPKGIDKQNPGR